jgi:citronellol/citronellal dehydrogenase
LKLLVDEVVERDRAGRDVPSVFSRSKFDAVVSTDKTADDDFDLEGSIEQTAREVREAEALAVELYLRDETRVETAVEEAIDHFSEADIVINNASAIQLSNSPPIVTDRSSGKAPYAWSKLGMSLITRSLAEELASDAGITVTSVTLQEPQQK